MRPEFGGFRWHVAAAAGPSRHAVSFDVVEECGGSDLEGAGEPDECVEARVAAGAFEQGDLGSVEVAGSAECFLGEAEAEPVASEVVGELLPRLHPADAPPQQTKPLQTKPLDGVIVG
jgi:hypothetical protein